MIKFLIKLYYISKKEEKNEHKIIFLFNTGRVGNCSNYNGYH